MSEERKRYWSPEEIDAACDEALFEAGWPLCPWIGTPHYSAHWDRKRVRSIRRMSEAMRATVEELSRES